MEENNNATQTTASPDQGTQEEAIATASPQGAEKVEVTVPQNPMSEGDNNKQRNVEAERGKIRMLEKTVNDLRKTSQTAKQKASAFDRMNTILGGDPSAYEAFRQSLKRQTGEDLGSYQEQFRNYQGASPQEGTSPQYQQNVPQQTQFSNQATAPASTGNVGQQVDVNAIGDIIEKRLDKRDQELQSKMETRTALEELIKENPSLDYRKITDQVKLDNVKDKLSTVVQNAGGLRASNLKSGKTRRRDGR